MINKNEISNSILKTMFSIVPLGGGQALNEIFFEYRGRIKQERLNQFIELLENFLSNHQGINLESYQTEEFSDLFESVLRRVTQTKSIEKLNMYKDILVNQLRNPEQNIDHSEIFLDLISTLGIIEIKILSAHREFKRNFQNEQNEYKALENKLEKSKNALILVTQKQSTGHDGEDKIYKADIIELESKLENKKQILEKWQEIKSNQYYSISSSDLLFYKQRLSSKGLLIDSGVGAIGGSPFLHMGITEFGIQFIDYIMSTE